MHDGAVADRAAPSDNGRGRRAHVHANAFLDVRPFAHLDARTVVAAQAGAGEHGDVLCKRNLADDGSVRRDTRLGADGKLTVIHAFPPFRAGSERSVRFAMVGVIAQPECSHAPSGRRYG